MAVAPMMYSEKFNPAGQVSDSQIARSQEMAQSFNQDQQAAMFQAHLQKGLQGMQEVMTQLPPEVASQVGDPTPMSGSDELRVQWYQGVNAAINRHNMTNAAAMGDQAGVDRMSLYGKDVPQARFDEVAGRQQARAFMTGFQSQVPGQAGAASSYAPAGNTTDLGKEDEVYINTAKETEKNLTAKMPWIEQYSKEYGVPKALALAFAGTESRGIQDSTSPTGVRGVFQLTEGTAKEMGVDREDEEGNIKGGIGYIKKKLDSQGGDIARAAAAYNGGDDAVTKAFEKYGDKWQDHLEEFLKPIPYTTKGGLRRVITPAQKAKEMREHAARTTKYNAYFGGSEGLSKTEAAAPAAAKSKTSQQVAEEALKAGMSPDMAKKMSDLLGTAGTQDLKAFELMLRAKHGEERQGRFEESEKRKGGEFTVKRADKYQKDNEKEIEAGIALKDLNDALVEAGLKGGIYGDPDSVDIPGIGVGAAAWRGYLQGQKGVDVRVASANLDMILRHKYFGATLTDNEQKAFKEAAGKGIPDNQKAFISALRKVNRRLKGTLRPTGRELRDYLRGEGVLTFEDLPDNADLDSLSEADENALIKAMEDGVPQAAIDKVSKKPGASADMELILKRVADKKRAKN